MSQKSIAILFAVLWILSIAANIAWGQTPAVPAVQVIQDKTAELQAFINNDADGIIVVDLTLYAGMGASSINIGSKVKSIKIDASQPIVFYMLPLTKLVNGQPVSMSKGLWHVQHNATTPEFMLPYFESGPNITYDGMGTMIRDPLKSDNFHNPLGLLRPIFFQIAYKEGTISRFVWRSNIRNTTKSAIHLVETADGLIDCKMEYANRHAIGAVWKQGSTPYNLVIRGEFNHVAAPFDLSYAANDSTQRLVVPNADIDIVATDVWWRTKMHGHWNATIELDSTGDGRNGWPGFDIAAPAIGVVKLRNSYFKGFPAKCVEWAHTTGTFEIEDCSYTDCYTPVYPGITPIVMKGPQVYDDCVLIRIPSVGDLIYKTKTGSLTTQQIEDLWTSRMRLAVDSFKSDNLTPTWWFAPLFYREMQDYAALIGWNGTAWQ